MTAGERGRGTLAGSMGQLYKRVEQSALCTRYGQRLLMVEEVMAHGREVALGYLVQSYSLIVVLRTRHGEEYKYNVEEEERAEYDEGGVCHPLVAAEEIVDCDGRYHGEVAEIAQRQQLAEHRRGVVLAEQQRRLTTEEGLFPRCKDVVEVDEGAVELVGVGVPPPQHTQWTDDAQQHRQPAGAPAVQLPQAQQQQHSTATAHEHLARTLQLTAHNGHQHQCKQRVSKYCPLKQL